MKYYTNIVPTPLWSKLLEKGMPISRITYAEVFDWLMTKGITINIFPDLGSINGEDMWRYTCDSKQTYVTVNAKGWIKTANDAILHAIELI